MLFPSFHKAALNLTHFFFLLGFSSSHMAVKAKNLVSIPFHFDGKNISFNSIFKYYIIETTSKKKN